MAEPQNLAILDELRINSGMDISPRWSFRGDILRGIQKFYTERVTSGGRAEVETVGDWDPSEIEFITTSSREENCED